MANNEFIYIPVPARWAATIYAELGDLAQAEKGAQDGNRAYVAPTFDVARRMYFDSQGPHRTLMEALARRPGEWLTTSQLATELQLENGSRGLAGMLGAFQRRANHRYDGQTPWQSEWDSVREESRHRMDPGVADAIRSAVKEAAEGW